MDKRFGFVLLSSLLIVIVTIITIAYARGYRPDLDNKTIDPTGILVATSDPDGALVTVETADRPSLQIATNSTANLAPGTYNVKISKDGFWDWQKKIILKKEEVYKSNAFLFPKAPDLRPLTFNGVNNIFPAPSRSRLAYSVATGSALSRGMWIFEMSGLPIVGNGNNRQISKTILKPFIWSFDERQLIASNSAGVYFLLETDRINDSPEIITNTQLKDLQQEWATAQSQKTKSQLSKLDPKLNSTLATSAANYKFSPDETRFIYTATASANLLPVLTSYLPGTNPTPENRKIEPGQIYVYDIKEDRNYEIADSLITQLSNYNWFSTSRHLVVNEGKQVSVMEYDGTNKATVYAGPFIDNFVFPWPGSPKIVILTSLNPTAGVGENLYTINLR